MPLKPLHETALSPECPAGPPDYAELHCLSNFTFLRGASFPEELVERADELGYRAIAITDECSLSGVVRAHTVAKEKGTDYWQRISPGRRLPFRSAGLQPARLWSFKSFDQLRSPGYRQG